MGGVLGSVPMQAKEYFIFHSSIKHTKLVKDQLIKTMVFVGESEGTEQHMATIKAGVMNIFFLFCTNEFISNRLRWIDHRHRSAHNVYVYDSPVPKPIRFHEMRSTIFYGAEFQRKKEFATLPSTQFFSRNQMIDKFLLLGVHNDVAAIETYQKFLPFENTPVVDFATEHLCFPGQETAVIFKNGLGFAQGETLDKSKNVFFVDITDEYLSLPIAFKNAALVMFLRCNTYFVSNVVDNLNLARAREKKPLPDIWIHAQPEKLPCFDGPIEKLFFNAESFTQDHLRIPVELRNTPMENIKQDRDFASLIDKCAAHQAISKYYAKHKLVYLNENSFFQLPTFAVPKSFVLKFVFVVVPCQLASDPIVIEASHNAWKKYSECPISPFGILSLSYIKGQEGMNVPNLRKKTAELMVMCEYVVFYMDEKSTWTEDMKFFLKEANNYGKIIVYRSLATPTTASL